MALGNILVGVHPSIHGEVGATGHNPRSASSRTTAHGIADLGSKWTYKTTAGRGRGAEHALYGGAGGEPADPVSLMPRKAAS
jgi:hypothetical protein